MNARDRLNLMHIGDEVIVTGTEMMSKESPSATDLFLIAIDLETCVRKIRVYASDMRRQGDI